MKIEQKIEQMIKYLEIKLHERDWHGVSDAANDIRVLEAQKTLELKITQCNFSDGKVMYAYEQDTFNPNYKIQDEE